ncbi:hypothetical protein FRUB_05533 [Fimbriiglobus ruber]|uniref:Uncharacterized protein n=1 Tax=Fimbriiglobus ruber TaxID=1908690 RepID=A0A225DLX1_9BACT|nr:hypothetical protein FRUB_05533 [Fimbriiglobus ruber]
MLGILFLIVGAGLFVFGPSRTGGAPDLVWGKRGVRDGDFARPRAAAIDHEDRLFIVDFTARVQCYDLDGKHLGFTWTTPDFRNGRPSGLGIDREGNLIVCDSHYHCVRIYTHDGTLLKTFGGEAGTKPGQWGYVSDCVQDAEGYYYVAEFGQNDRITKLDQDGKFVACWGEQGQEPGQLNRARALAFSPDGLLFVADACNHRIQVFTRDGQFVRAFGEPGSGPGQLQYPYDLAFGPAGDLYVVERGNGRVQKFTPDGKSLGTWGSPGHGPGQLADPWAIVVDRRGRLHVIDTENHRVQRVRF